jgi:hypothetical protein
VVPCTTPGLPRRTVAKACHDMLPARRTTTASHAATPTSVSCRPACCCLRPGCCLPPGCCKHQLLPPLPSAPPCTPPCHVPTAPSSPLALCPAVPHLQAALAALQLDTLLRQLTPSLPQRSQPRPYSLRCCRTSAVPASPDCLRHGLPHAATAHKCLHSTRTGIVHEAAGPQLASQLGSIRRGQCQTHGRMSDSWSQPAVLRPQQRLLLTAWGRRGG